MTGVLKASEVLISDPIEASQIHNKGYYGVPQSGGSLRLSLMEATYLVDSGRLEVESRGKSLETGDLMRLAHKASDGFEIQYLVYRELRQRGYIVKLGQPPLDFRVFPRGGSPNKTPSKWWVAAISERSTFDLGDMLDNLDRASEIRKKLLLAVVDEESDVTYYEVKRVSPGGRLEVFDAEGRIEAVSYTHLTLPTTPYV